MADSLHRLEQYTFKHVSPLLYEKLGIDANKQALIKYLEDRVSYIVGNNAYKVDFLLELPTLPEGVKKYYPSLYSRSYLKTKDSETYSPLWADCAGCDKYAQSQFLGMSVAVSVGDEFYKVLNSPNTEIINLNIGMFYPSVAVDEKNQFSEINQIERIALYFHEARHHDSSPFNDGYLHSYCPPGHKKEGVQHCDITNDGPQTVQVEILSALLKECITCTENDRIMLNSNINSLRDNVIHDKKDFLALKNVSESMYIDCIAWYSNATNFDIVKNIINIDTSDFFLDYITQSTRILPKEFINLTNDSQNIYEVVNSFIQKDSKGCESHIFDSRQKEICSSISQLATLTSFLNKPINVEQFCREATNLVPDSFD